MYIFFLQNRQHLDTSSFDKYINLISYKMAVRIMIDKWKIGLFIVFVWVTAKQN